MIAGIQNIFCIIHSFYLNLLFERIMENFSFKHTYLIILLFCASVNSYAQNWMPINTAYKYNYYADSNVFENICTIWTDSVGFSDNDSVYYLNKIVTLKENYKMIKNAPQFLQRKMIKKSTGEIIFTDTSTFIIKPNCSLGDSWIFDSLNNISAQIIDVGYLPILGNDDSVKTIKLSSSDTIILSKNYGIIKFSVSYLHSKKYYLAGIEGLNLGLNIPKLEDYLIFNIGDVFEYYTKSEHLTPSVYSSYYSSSNYKYTITSKSINNDTISYNINFLKLSSTPNGYGIPHTLIYECGSSQFILIKNQYSYLNFYNKEYVGNDSIFRQLYFFHNNELDADGKALSRLFGPSHDNDIVYVYNQFAYSYISYLEGKGLYNFFSAHSDSYYPIADRVDSTLVGCKINGIIYGELHPDSFFIDPNDTVEAIEIYNVFPNPSTGKFTVTIPPTTQEIQIFNSIGNRIVKREDLYQKSSVDFELLNNGVYIIQIITDEQNIKKKLIVTHKN